MWLTPSRIQINKENKFNCLYLAYPFKDTNKQFCFVFITAVFIWLTPSRIHHRYSYGLGIMSMISRE